MGGSTVGHTKVVPVEFCILMLFVELSIRLLEVVRLSGLEVVRVSVLASIFKSDVGLPPR